MQLAAPSSWCRGPTLACSLRSGSFRLCRYLCLPRFARRTRDPAAARSYERGGQVAQGASKLECKRALSAYLDHAAALHRSRPACASSQPRPSTAAGRPSSSGAPTRREQGRQAAAAQDSSPALPDLATHMDYVGQITFLFSHIKQTLMVGLDALAVVCCIICHRGRKRAPSAGREAPPISRRGHRAFCRKLACYWQSCRPHLLALLGHWHRP